MQVPLPKSASLRACRTIARRARFGFGDQTRHPTNVSAETSLLIYSQASTTCSTSRSSSPMSERPLTNPYAQNLDKCAANYQPLTPLTLLQRAAAVYPAHTAVVHGDLRLSYAEFYARCRRLASALAKRGIGVGDTVTVMLPNTPAMLETHYAVPMTGAVLHSLNTRLDAAVLAFQLDHAESKVVICDREFAGTMRTAL